ncbi:hypothetical protein AB0X52_05790 [Ligilactobacillus saerimneri]|nr:hypothetical protein [Ligilactobacillus saerimneri]
MTMTEHEKELAGQEYDYRDPELQMMIAYGQKYSRIINTTTDMDERANLNKWGKGLL